MPTFNTMGDFVWASDNARNWEEEEDQQEQYLELMYMHQLYNGIIQNQQYVLRGSKLSCSYGTSYSLLDTAQDHGIYKEDLAVLTTIDSGKSNICDFGSCLCPESNYVGRLPMTCIKKRQDIAINRKIALTKEETDKDYYWYMELLCGMNVNTERTGYYVLDRSYMPEDQKTMFFL